MNLKYSYWYFTGVIPPEVCDRIIAIGKKEVPKLGQVNRRDAKTVDEYTDAEVEELKSTRDSHISWLDLPWIYNILKPLVNQANKDAGWNFQWDYTEQAQFTIYKPGQFYEWHPDQHHFLYGENDHELMRGKYRKLSTTLLLNDPSEFEGGELEFHYDRTKEECCKGMTAKGSLVVFPSFVYHRVRPVTKGTRYSLVTWNLGFPFT